MSLCRDLASYRRGIEWSDATRRWLDRQPDRGIRRASAGSTGASSCGCWATSQEAEGEASRACEEVAGFSLVHAGVAQHELGEVRLRLGDLEGAEVAFGRAQELGEDPQPGLALLRLAQGDPSAAVASIGRSLEGAAYDGFARARMLSAQAEIARAAADAERATEARERTQRARRAAPLSRGARRERMGGRAGRPPGGRSGEPPPCTSARRAIGGAPRPPRTRPRRRRSRSPKRSCCGETGTPPPPSSAPRAPRSNGSAQRWMLVAPQTWRSGSGAEDRPPGPSGRSCSRTSSARPR